MGGGFFRKAGAVVAVLGLVAGTPAAAQRYSDAYEFLKAVKERDGTKATALLNEPGNTLANAKDRTTGETALHYAVQRRDETWVRFLLERGANPNAADFKGITPLAIAATLGFVEGVERLTAKGARVDVNNAAGETPLIAAVHRRDLGVIRLLLKKGANPDRADNSGRSARDYATLMGASAGVLGEIERGEAERKAGAAKQGAYGPGI